jgi:hypothetical protein
MQSRHAFPGSLRWPHDRDRRYAAVRIDLNIGCEH